MRSKNMLDAARKAEEKARVYTPRHFSCSLGTILAEQEAIGIRDESVFKAASGLHGGMGTFAGLCIISTWTN